MAYCSIRPAEVKRKAKKSKQSVKYLTPLKRIRKTKKTLKSSQHNQDALPKAPLLCPEPKHLNFKQLDKNSTVSEVKVFWEGFSSKVQEWNERRFLYCIQRTIYENDLQQLSKNPYDPTVAKIWNELKLEIQERKCNYRLALEYNAIPEVAEVFSSYRVIAHRGQTLSSRFSAHLPLVLDLSGKYGHITIYNSHVALNRTAFGVQTTVVMQIPCFKLILSQIRFQIFVIVRPCASRSIIKHGSLLIGHRICLCSKYIDKVQIQTEPIGPDEAYYLITLKITTKVETMEVVYFITPNLGKENANVIHRYRTGPIMRHPGNELIDIFPILPIRSISLPKRRPNISQVLEQICL